MELLPDFHHTLLPAWHRAPEPDLCLAAVQVGVTDAVVRAAGLCPRLTALHIPDAYRVTDQGLAGLRRATQLVRCAPTWKEQAWGGSEGWSGGLAGA